MSNIENQFNRIYKNVATIDGTMSYDEITDAIIELANTITKTETDEYIWDSLGAFGGFTLGDLIVGAYWHYSEWHHGQWSKGYAALSALGKIFSPGVSVPEKDNMAYELLNDMAEKRDERRRQCKTSVKSS